MTETTPTTATTIDLDEPERICLTVVQDVADANGVSPLELDPLATVIDPDALETLVASMCSLPGEPTGTIEFEFNGRTVSVRGDGAVSVE